MEDISDITCINTGAIRNAIQNIKSTIKEGNRAVEQIESSLKDDIWKARARETLKEGYEKLKDFPNENINSILTTMENVCSKIDELNKVLNTISKLNNQKNLSEADEQTLAEKIVRRNALAREIRSMCN